MLVLKRVAEANRPIGLLQTFLEIGGDLLVDKKPPTARTALASRADARKEDGSEG